MSAYEVTDEMRRTVRCENMILSILKKYSRAAGDRSQWRKVEAMFGGMRS